MQFTLCYKEYGFKPSLGAIKQFNDSTGKDLWCTLMKAYRCFMSTHQQPIADRLIAIYSECDFITASHVFYAMAKQENKQLTLEEIQDAMVRVGWSPVNDESDKGEPWPLVMVEVAIMVDQYYSKQVVEQKK